MSIATVILLAAGLPVASGLQTSLINADFSSNTIASGDWQTQANANYNPNLSGFASLGSNMHPALHLDQHQPVIRWVRIYTRRWSYRVPCIR